MRKKLLILILILATLTASLLALTGIAEASDVTVPAYTKQAREMLSEYDKALYDRLSEKIQALKASDDEQSTRFSIDYKSLGGAKYSWSAVDTGSFPVRPGDEYTVADAFCDQFAFENVLNALMHDMPLDMYWYNKTGTGGSKMLISHDGNNITALSVSMQVSSMHRGMLYSAEYPSVVNVKTTYESTYTKAMTYVDKYEGKSDYSKIKGYIQEICDLTDYDKTANSSTPYSDIWQATYVFDGDKDTNVVCEGYSKAFQLLCNLSAFSDTSCYTISGYLGTNPTQGGHMWNLVTIGNKSYLVDVTNSDAGSVGQDGSFILKAHKSGSYADGYSFINADKTKEDAVVYNYYDWTKSLWGSSLLTLSASDYTVPSVSFTLTSNAPSGGFIYDGEDVTVGADTGSDVYYTLDDGNWSDYSLEFSYYNDNNGKLGSEVSSVCNVGTYWIKVKATSYADSNITGTSVIRVEVTPKPLTVVDMTVADKVYDKSKEIALTSAELQGIIGSDDVRLSDQSTVSLAHKNAGEHEFVYLTEVVLEGNDKSNYTVCHSPTDPIYLTNPVTVSKRTITVNAPIFEYVIADTAFMQFDFAVSGTYNGSVETGIVYWYDSSDTKITDMTTLVLKGEVYKWELVFNDTNFNSATGTVEIYPDDDIIRVTTTVADSEKGTATTGGREGFIAGETVTLTATAKSGYQFDCWVINGEVVSSDATYSFTVTADTTVEARFKAIQTTQSGGEDTAMLTQIIDTLKVLIPYIPYIIIGGGVLGLTILILLYIRISKKSKRKKN